MVSLLQQRSVQITFAVWIVLLVMAYVLGHDELPFDRPLVKDLPFNVQLGFALFGSLALPFLYMGITYFITRNRVVPDIASRAPDRALALREVLYLILYGLAVFAGGQVIGRLVFGG